MARNYIIIPARYASSRFPGKPLVSINGKSMIQWVYDACVGIEEIEEVYVATDNKKIYDCVESFGGKCLMTSDKHASGSDRLAECVDLLNLEEQDVILNIQGDEPLIKREMILELLETMQDESACMGTLKEKIRFDDEIINPNIVKVVTDKDDFAIYFSRSPIPYDREANNKVDYFRHVGVYAYRAGFLKKYTSLPQGTLEKAEKLEQLRALENGFRIKVKETKNSSVGVDLPEQVSAVEMILGKK